MIGTGVFTSLGFQLLDVQNTWSIIALWSLGGIMALAGAFCYAEVGSLIRESGGEYIFLSKIYHPLLGYISGWISLIVGFAAPVALAAMALGVYLGNVIHASSTLIAVLTIVLVTLIHSFNLETSSKFQSVATWLKVIFIAGLIAAGILIAGNESTLDFTSGWTNEITTASFAIAFVYVSYSYTGWNATAYIIEEVKQPRINLPKALIRGTALVTGLYILLQMVFLKHASIEELSGKIDIGHVYASNLFGNEGALIINLLISLFLVSSISAMVWVGPRVSFAMSRNYAIWKFLRKQNRAGIPTHAVWFQAILSIIYVLSGTFEGVLLYCGFILQLSSALVVAGVFVLRTKDKWDPPYKSPLYPILPIIFSGLSIWILVYLIIDKPLESLFGLLILLIGAITYMINLRLSSNN